MNEMAFCTSCRSMKVNLEEYKETIHYKNASGVQASVQTAMYLNLCLFVFFSENSYAENLIENSNLIDPSSQEKNEY